MTILPNIAFIGSPGAGKTTCAQKLVEGYGYEKLSFATPLKVMLATTTDRARMQEFGTDVVRAYEPDAWVNLFIAEFNRRFDELVNLGAVSRPHFVVDDARFLNEVRRLKVEGFVIVRVVAPTTFRIDRLKANGKFGDGSELDHAAEHELDDFEADYRIVNDGWTDDLNAELADILNRERS